MNISLIDFIKTNFGKWFLKDQKTHFADDKGPLDWLPSSSSCRR